MDDLQLRSLVLFTRGFVKGAGQELLKCLAPQLIPKATSWWDGQSAAKRAVRQAEVVGHFGLRSDVSLRWRALLKSTTHAVVDEVYRSVAAADRCLLPRRVEPGHLSASSKPTPPASPALHALALGILREGRL